MDLALENGSTFDEKFEILSLAGSGGMGSVFKARQLGLERLVAIKILNPELVSNEESCLRFEREARATSILSHTHIATFYSYGITQEGLPYIAMEFVEGASLRSFLYSQEKLPWRRAAKIARQVCQAMSKAHKEGMIHRDLKPENILLMEVPEADYVKIVDFGLAKLIEAVAVNKEQKLTGTGMLVGSTNYLSPEQCQGQAADPRSDIYSLACILYESLTGTPPFQADNAIGLVHKHISEPPIPPSSRAGLNLPKGLDEIVLKGLSKSPEKRYQSMSEFDNDLEQIEMGQGDSIKLKVSQRVPASNSSRTIIIAISTVILLTLLTTLALHSPDGQCILARMHLRTSPTEKTRMYWLDASEKFERDGNRSAADKMREEVEHSCNDLTYLDCLIKMSEERLKGGEKKAALNWAFRCLSKLSNKSAYMASARLNDLSDLLERASLVIIKTDERITRSQMSIISSIRRVAANQNIHFVQLFSKAGQDTGMVTDLELYQAYEQLAMKLAELGQTDELKQSLSMASLLGKKVHRNTADIPHLYFAAAANIAKTNRDCALQLLHAGKVLLDNCPDRESSAYAHCLYCLSTGYGELGDRSNAVKFARLTLDQASRFNNYGPIAKAEACHLLARALVVDEKYEEAAKIANMGIAIVKAISNDDFKHLGMLPGCLTVLSDALAPREQWSTFIQKSGEVLAILRKHLPNSAESVVHVLRMQAHSYDKMNKLKEAKAHLREALNVSKQYKISYVETFGLQMNYMLVCIDHGDNQAAISMLPELRKIPANFVMGQYGGIDGFHIMLDKFKEVKDTGSKQILTNYLKGLAATSIHESSNRYKLKRLLEILCAAEEYDSAINFATETFKLPALDRKSALFASTLPASAQDLACMLTIRASCYRATKQLKLAEADLHLAQELCVDYPISDVDKYTVALRSLNYLLDLNKIAESKEMLKRLFQIQQVTVVDHFHWYLNELSPALKKYNRSKDKSAHDQLLKWLVSNGNAYLRKEHPDPITVKRLIESLRDAGDYPQQVQFIEKGERLPGLSAEDKDWFARCKKDIPATSRSSI